MKVLNGLREGLIWVGLSLLLEVGLYECDPELFRLSFKPHLWHGCLMIAAAIAILVKLIGETTRGKTFYQWLRG